jgi:uncharacterized Zn finger protein
MVVQKKPCSKVPSGSSIRWASSPSTAAKRSTSRGSVLEVDRVETDHLYSARVPGERVHEVQLEFANGEWEAKCSCPVAARCKDIAAAILALEERESESGNGVPPSRTENESPRL